MKLYVPEIGDKIVLTEDWKFNLHWESRNQAAVDYFKVRGTIDKIHNRNTKEFSAFETKQKVAYDAILTKYKAFVHRESITREDSVAHQRLLFEAYRSANMVHEETILKLAQQRASWYQLTFKDILANDQWAVNTLLNRDQKVLVEKLGVDQILVDNWKVATEARQAGLNLYHSKSVSVPVTWPKGTVLKIDRIYIRKGLEDFSSLTFTTKPEGMKKQVRFWAKLADVNKIEFEHAPVAQ